MHYLHILLLSYLPNAKFQFPVSVPINGAIVFPAFKHLIFDFFFLWSLLSSQRFQSLILTPFLNDPRFPFTLLSTPHSSEFQVFNISVFFFKSLIIGYLANKLSFWEIKQIHQLAKQANYTKTGKLYQTMIFNTNYLKSNCYNTSLFRPIYSYNIMDK